MKQMRNIQQHFSIRKLTVGAVSVLIGLSFLGFGTQTVHADANAASNTSVQTVTEKTSTTDGTDNTVKVDTPVDANATTDSASNVKVEEKVATEQPVAKSVEKSVTPTPDVKNPVKNGGY